MNDFKDLVPDLFLPALEEALSIKLTPLIRTFPSYINRVYEIQTIENVSYVVKFYRPGRWTLEALRDEHAFVFDCAEVEIPVVCPLKLTNGSSLGMLGDIAFAIFPKKGGRQFDIEGDESWQRVGVLLGRLHNAGQKRKAPARLVLSPQITTKEYADLLVQDGVTKNRQKDFKDTCYQIINAISPYFENMESIRIHGDFHTGNILERPDTGLMVIDFDDMMNGSPVQDVWLLLPDHYPACKHYLDQLLSGYRMFRDIDPRAPLLIEGLRAMRMIYFLAWCNMQRDDFQFKARNPDWGTDAFWAQETRDLRLQYANIMDAFSDQTAS
jgi:Ser/Thr protein kinase RdoA (MazF antagonist)